MSKQRTNYTGQIFGTRKIINNKCNIDDFLNIGRKLPNAIGKYRLSECLICGSHVPVLIKNIIQSPPKHCPMCSRYGRNVTKTIADRWIKCDDCAVGIIPYKDKVINCYIDLSDYDRVKEYSWRISKKRNKYYVVTGSQKNKTDIYLHKFIINKPVPNGFEVDHIDGNSLNNRRNNLRIVKRICNIQNVSARIDNTIGIRGICKTKNGYTCDFSFNNKRFYFKDWKTIEEAVYCRKYAEEYFGLEMLNRNPLSQKYLVLSPNESYQIKKYVKEIISRK